MKKISTILMTLLPICTLIPGCFTSTAKEVKEEPKASGTYAVVIGMENSRFAGSCPGAAYDAVRMSRLLSKYATNVVLLRDGTATKANVTSAIRNAIDKAGEGMVILYYSGHGGSEPFPDTGIEEVDGMDEFLCLWDTYLRDNEIWAMMTKCKGRFFMMCDACHSQTLWRSPGFSLVPPLSWDHTVNEKQPFSMLCWSGCPDANYSYGASTGGQFTNALFRHFKESMTYEEVWEKLKNDKILRRFEDPQSTALGDGFANKVIFR